jgi:hypothetical protein
MVFLLVLGARDMTRCRLAVLAFLAVAVISPPASRADNPLILDQFTADPTARVFDGKIYVYPSHDILASEGKGRPGWFCMEDYHVFSSENLLDWQDHGVIVSQTSAPWVDSNSYSMWAPDCVERDGKYYFYFPARGKGGRRGSSIGVAIADKPGGPFTPEPKPIEGVVGIDPNVFIDKDGQAYLLYSLNKIFIAKLKPNMLELDSPVEVIDNLPTKGLIEGPFMFERNGVYYLTYPHVENKTERLEYATGDNPLGPFKPAGVIMDESVSGCWTNHHSIVPYNGQWILFYHDKDLSPGFDKARAIRADYLSFNDDGTIQKVTPTLRGVGVADARRKLQVDRYSAISDAGASVAFLNDANKHEGWKTTLEGQGAWVRYDRVDFGGEPLKAVTVRTAAPSGGLIEIRQDNPDGPVLARVKIEPGANWAEAKAELAEAPTGVHDLVVSLPGEGRLEVDWVSFQ